MLSRVILIIDRDDTVRYVEYVKEVAQHLKYDRVLGALEKVVAGASCGAGVELTTGGEKWGRI